MLLGGKVIFQPYSVILLLHEIEIICVQIKTKMQ